MAVSPRWPRAGRPAIDEEGKIPEAVGWIIIVLLMVPFTVWIAVSDIQFQRDIRDMLVNPVSLDADAHRLAQIGVTLLLIPAGVVVTGCMLLASFPSIGGPGRMNDSVWPLCGIGPAFIHGIVGKFSCQSGDIATLWRWQVIALVASWAFLLAVLYAWHKDDIPFWKVGVFASLTIVLWMLPAAGVTALTAWIIQTR